MKQQYIITERNDWEKETFSYVMNLSPIQYKKFCNTLLLLDKNKCLSIKESSYTQEDIDKINEKSNNTYMRRIGFYTLDKDFAFHKWKEFGQFFYKGLGLKFIS